jgi:putative addiction module component (TIGR02574 family)
MPATKAEILELAKALPQDERRELLEELRALLLPLPDGMTYTEFRAELDRRWEEYKSGKVKMMTWEEVVRQIRERRSAADEPMVVSPGGA